MARWTVDNSMTSPDYQWSIQDLQDMQVIGNQIDEIEAEINRLNDAYSGADNAGAWEECSRIETRVEVLTEALIDLQAEYRLIGTDDH